MRYAFNQLFLCLEYVRDNSCFIITIPVRLRGLKSFAYGIILSYEEAQLYDDKISI